MSRLGKQSEFREGLRVTDGETIDIVRMVLIGQVNPQLVAAINVHGPLAVGVSGADAGLIGASDAARGRRSSASCSCPSRSFRSPFTAERNSRA